MPVLLKNIKRKQPDANGRVRNYLANRNVGAQSSTIHENILSPGGVVPWHSHACEEIIIILDGAARCLTSQGPTDYEPGDVLIMAPREEHTIENTGTIPMRQLCFFPSTALDTTWRDSETIDGQSLVVNDDEAKVQGRDQSR
jgi:quercetin dioxygenase-like cupin family protein